MSIKSILAQCQLTPSEIGKLTAGAKKKSSKPVISTPKQKEDQKKLPPVSLPSNGRTILHIIMEGRGYIEIRPLGGLEGEQTRSLSAPGNYNMEKTVIEGVEWLHIQGYGLPYKEFEHFCRHHPEQMTSFKII